MNGLVLVFDVDQTLIDTNGAFEQIKPDGSNTFEVIRSRINWNLVEKILRPAVLLRDEGRGVSAIFLLTNNSSYPYIANICQVLTEDIEGPGGLFNTIREHADGDSNFPNVPNIFDYVMVRQHPSRKGVLEKRIEDVKYMMAAIGLIPYSSTKEYEIARVTYFFDDDPNHLNLKNAFRLYNYRFHYTEIQGPDVFPDGRNRGFISGKPDLTEYRPVLSAISRAAAGENPVPSSVTTGGRRAKTVVKRKKWRYRSRYTVKYRRRH